MQETKSFTLFILFFLFIGCSSTPKKDLIKQEPLPQWIQTPQQDDQDSIWGIGIASSREDAIKLALDELVSKLGVSLESSYKSQHTSSLDHIYKSTTHTLKSEVSKITLNHYKIVKTQKLHTREFAVLLQVDKKRLFDGLSESLFLQQQALEQQLLQHAKEANLVRFYQSQKIAKQADEMLPKIMIAYALDESFAKNDALLFLQKTHKYASDTAKELHFFIDASKDAKEYVIVLQEYLRSVGFQVSKHKNETSTNIQLFIDTKRTSILDIQILIHNIELSVIDEKGDLLGGKVYKFKSRLGHGAESFGGLIEGKSPQEILGITKSL